MENAKNLELLNYVLENGILDKASIQKQMEMSERKRLLQQHTWEIWQGTDKKWYTYLPGNIKKGGRRLKKRNTKKEIEDVIVEYYRIQEKSPLFENVFEEWINQKLYYKEIQKQTYDRYRTDFTRFFEKSNLLNVRMNAVSDEMLEDFIRETIRKKKLSSKAWSGLRLILNGMFKYAKKKGYTDISISTFMGDLDLSRNCFTKRTKTDEEMVFTDEEIHIITEYIKNENPSIVNMGIQLSFQAGLRAGELAGLKYDDLVGNVLTVQRTEIHYKNKDGGYSFDIRERTKGEEGIRKVVVSDETVRLIKQARIMNPFGEYLFMKDGIRLKGKSFTTKLYKICDAVGINRRSVHKARKTYATKLLNAGINEKLIEKQMGHTDIATTKDYYFYNNQNLEKTVEIIRKAIK